MTSLRFVGDLPLWLGLTLAAIVAVLSFLYYNRESFELPGRLRIVLPLLRSLAFVLGILILTGPVLHHRKTIGELGKVKIFIDASQSMTQNDKHMSLVRKLKIAKQLGWITGEVPGTAQLEALDQIAESREKLAKVLEEAGGDSVPENAVSRFLKDLSKFQAKLPEPDAESVAKQVAQPLNELSKDSAKLVSNQIDPILQKCQSLEAAIFQKLNADLKIKLGTTNESLAASIDLFDEAARWRRVELALNESAARPEGVGSSESDASNLSVLELLRQKHEVEVFLVHDNPNAAVEKIDLDQPLDFSEMAESNSFAVATNLSTSVSNKLNDLVSETDDDADASQSKNKTAIVLLSDGQHNTGPSPIQTSRILGAQGKEIYSVSIGSLRSAVDLAVVKVEYPKLVFEKDEIRGTMVVRDSMTPGKPFVAQVKHDDKVLWQKQLVAQNVKDRRIDFEFKVDELIDELDDQQDRVKTHMRQLSLAASIIPLAEESEPTNNQRDMKMSVITDGYQVLILDGRSRWESRFIRNAFERDEQWQVNTIIAGKTTGQKSLPRGEQNDQFPTSRKQLFEYDLIIWGEVDPNLFDAEELEWIREFVEIRGGGIVFIDGQRGKLRELDESSLGNLVPVSTVNPALTELPDSLELTPKGMEQTALALAVDKQENQEFWTELPSPHTLVPIEATPDAEVLVNVVHGENRYPAIVSRKYGAGNVLYLAFDESWRWRYKTADTWHQRAWHQLAKFAMPQPFAVSDDYVSIDTGPASYESGENHSIRIQLKGLDGQANSDATVDALIWQNGKIVSSVNLVSDSAVPGVYRTELEALPAGDYEVSIRASGYKESVLNSRGQFTVLPPDSGEMSETSINENLLRQMSTESNGKYLREEDLAKLPELLEPLSNGRVVESETLLWQSYWWFGGMMLLLTIEWILRKRSGLL